MTAHRDGFSVNAAVSSQSYQRHRLERLSRYVIRPAICLERLTVKADGQIQYELKYPFRRGRLRITLCPLCGGTTGVIADITDPDLIQKILDHIEPQPPIKSATATVHLLLINMPDTEILMNPSHYPTLPFLIKRGLYSL